eukprot:7772736-Lingulodinium_polyedra.AAC.1
MYVDCTLIAHGMRIEAEEEEEALSGETPGDAPPAARAQGKKCTSPQDVSFMAAIIVFSMR